MKFSNAIAFILVNLAATVTAVALPQTTEVTVITQTAIVERQEATQVGGGNGPATQTQALTLTRTAAAREAPTAVAERQAVESPFTIINARTEAAPAALPATLLKVLRRQEGESSAIPDSSRETGPPVPIGARQIGAPLLPRQSGIPRVSGAQVESAILARQTSDPVPIEARQDVARPLPTVGPVKARQDGESPTEPIPTAAVVAGQDTPAQHKAGDDLIIYTASTVPTEAAVVRRQGGDSVIFTVGAAPTQPAVAM